VIARLRGKVVSRSAAGIVLDVNGVGYLVAATPSVARLSGFNNGGEGDEITIETHLHIRADVLQLYGFASAAERELFELLLSVSGVGPKVALAIVSGSTPEELRRAIARDDLKRFEAIPGVGRKTAQRVVLELKDKLTVADGAGHGGRDDLTARDALVELGWALVDAERALAELEPDLPVAEQVRQALRAAA
jgi:holliday junction DNA helicase RuvA